MANRSWPSNLLFSLLVVFVGLFMPRSALAGQLDLERPGQRQFVADHAEVLDAKAEATIKRVAAQLLDEHATPIVVVTIESMAAHGGAGMSIESFSRALFDQWGVGHPTLEQTHWDTGILLVISKQDRKARIELGAGWAHSKDGEARRIMNDLIVPAFKQGDYSGGTVDGVEALATMARTKPVPEPRRRAWTWFYELPDWVIDALLITVLVLLAIGMVISLVNSGRQGWAWMLIAGVFSLLWAIVLSILLERIGSRRRGSKGDCGPRGSFGGGRSGGGGASGDW